MQKSIGENEVIKNIASVSGIVIFAKLLGFIKQMIVAGAFGATIETDLISLSQNLIGDMDYLLAQVAIAAFIPIYTGIKRESEEKASAFVSNILATCMVISALAIAVLQASAPFVAKIIAPTYTGGQHMMLIKYIRIYAPMLLLMPACAVYNALLRANRRFVQGELVSVIQSVTVIVLVLLFAKKIGTKTLIASYFAYTVINTLFLASAAKKEWQFKRTGKLYDENVKKIIRMSLPLLFGYAMIFINQQVDKVIVSGLGEGAVTAIGYAAVLTNLVATLVGSVCSIIFTYISRCIADHKEKEAGMLIRQSAVLFTTILVPVCVLVILNAEDIVRIVYGRGAFSEAAIHNTAVALIGYGISVIFYAYRELFSRLQYSYMDSRQPMLNSTIGITSNIILSLFLSKIIGIMGVAIATSVSVAVCSVLNVMSSRKHNTYVQLGKTFSYLPYWIIGIFICVFVSKATSIWLTGDSAMRSITRFVVITFTSFTMYGLVCFSVIKNSISVLNKMVKDGF